MCVEEKGRPGPGVVDGVLALLAATVIVALFLAAPGSLLDKADRAAYAVCDRLAQHSYFFAGRQLPLCAPRQRHLSGALAGFIVLARRGRGRAAGYPARRYLAVLAGFVALWACDGLNSFLTQFPGLPHLYEPSNVVRLMTGTLEGLALTCILLPVVNFSFWRDAAPGPSVGSWRDLAWLLVGGAVVVALVASGWGGLLYPLALASGLMVVALVGLLNAVAVLLVWRRAGEAASWRPLAAPCLLGVAFAMGELAAIGLLRGALAATLGLPS